MIETLNIENYHLDTESLTEFFSSQTGIRKLRMKIEKLPAWVMSNYFEKVAEVLIKHQDTIEAIDIDIQTLDHPGKELGLSQKSTTNIQGMIACKERLSFPRLTSLKLMSEAPSVIKELSNDLFESLIASRQLEEVDFFRFDNDEFFSPYFKIGNLGRLKKCYGVEFGRHAQTLIPSCPSITHLESEVKQIYDYDPMGYTDFVKKVTEMISFYGPQLKHLGCHLNSVELANTILDKCKNNESLTLSFLRYSQYLQIFEGDSDG